MRITARTVRIRRRLEEGKKGILASPYSFANGCVVGQFGELVPQRVSPMTCAPCPYLVSYPLSYSPLPCSPPTPFYQPATHLAIPHQNDPYPRTSIHEPFNKPRHVPRLFALRVDIIIQGGGVVEIDLPGARKEGDKLGGKVLDPADVAGLSAAAGGDDVVA
jgi:hypothetical protein